MSFLTGFATGFAKSVDAQLKESIERTRDNIDMVSKWRLKKAEEREKERRKKDQEIETMIKDAAFVIGGDQNNVDAQNIAAALYKERGLSGFTSDIEFMRKQVESGVGVRPLDFINRANVDAPENRFKLSEIVRSLSDAESSYAPTDMIFPKGTIKPSGMIGAIVPGFDVMAAGETRATQQMQEMGMETVPTATSLSFTKYTFDREGLTYHTKDTNEKLSWLRNIIVDPSSTPSMVEKAKEREEALLKLSIDEGDAKNALAAAQQMLNRAKPTDDNYESLVTQVTDLKDRISLQEAELEGEAAVLKVQATIAARDGTDEGLAEALRLTRKARDIEAGGIVTTETKLSDLEEDMQRKKAQFGDAYMNSTGQFVGKGYAEDNKMRMTYRTELANFKGTTTNDINSMVTTIYSNAKRRLAGMDPVLLDIVNRAESAGSDPSKQFDVLMAEMIAARERGDVNQNSIEAFKDAIRDVAAKTKAIKAELGEETISVDRALDILLSESVSDTTSGAVGSTVAGQTDEALGQVSTGAGEDSDGAGEGSAGAGVINDADIKKLVDSKQKVDESTLNTMRADYPNTIKGALDFINQDIFKQQDVTNEKTGQVTSIPKATENEIIAESVGLHNEEFTNTIRNLLDPNVRKTITEALDSGEVFKQGEVGIVVDKDARDAVVQSLIQGNPTLGLEVTNHIVNEVIQERTQVETENLKKNIPLVKDALDRKNFLSNITGQLIPYRRDQAIEYIATMLNVSPENADMLIQRAIAPADDISAFDVEAFDIPTDTSERDDVSPEERDARIAAASKEISNNPIANALKGDRPLVGEDGLLLDVGDVNLSNALTDFSKRSSDGEKRESLVSKPNKRSGVSSIALAMKYVDGTLTAKEAKELRKRVEGPDGADIAMAIQRIRERRKAEKEVSAYTDADMASQPPAPKDSLSPSQVKALQKRTSRQGKARGGLMRR